MIKISFRKTMHTPAGPGLLDVDVTIQKGEFVSFFGESGAGKTTFLRVLAGLVRPEEGYIEVDGDVWFDSKRCIDLSVQKRKVGFVFQDSQLFPHLNVLEHLQFASEKVRIPNIARWLKLMNLHGLEKHKPSQLSGGQKQRVALACALIRQPKILLLDEPLSSLDTELRLKLQDEILSAYQKTRITTILVSHDLSEVFKMSQKVFVIEEGKVKRSGPPKEVFIDHHISGKFKFTGEILEIHKDGVVNILTVRIGNNITKVVATDEEIAGLSVGGRIIVVTKAFNPVIFKH